MRMSEMGNVRAYRTMVSTGKNVSGPADQASNNIVGARPAAVRAIAVGANSLRAGGLRCTPSVRTRPTAVTQVGGCERLQNTRSGPLQNPYKLALTTRLSPDQIGMALGRG